jgi:hypothetical protein
MRRYRLPAVLAMLDLAIGLVYCRLLGNLKRTNPKSHRRKSSGSFATLAAIRRDSARVPTPMPLTGRPCASINPSRLQTAVDAFGPSPFDILEPDQLSMPRPVADQNRTPREPAMPELKWRLRWERRWHFLEQVR